MFDFLRYRVTSGVVLYFTLLYFTLLYFTLLYFSWRWWWWGVLFIDVKKERLFTYLLVVTLYPVSVLLSSPSQFQNIILQKSSIFLNPNLLITNKAICPVRGNFSTSSSSQLNIITSKENPTLPTWTKSEVGNPPSWTSLKHHTQFLDRLSSTSNCFLQHAPVRFRWPVSPSKSIAQSYEAMLIQSKKKKALSAA